MKALFHKVEDGKRSGLELFTTRIGGQQKRGWRGRLVMTKKGKPQGICHNLTISSHEGGPWVDSTIRPRKITFRKKGKRK